MIVRDVHDVLESWAPKEIAWDRDNVGLQVGSMKRRVRRILVALDVTDEVLLEARSKKIDLVITHHPLLFHPVRSLTPEDRVGRLVHMLARSGIALYSAHTNLDFAQDGVSFALARRLGLHGLEFLRKDQSVLMKIVTFVPKAHLEAVASAMAGAGAGTIGDYDDCSFRAEGTGTFKARTGAKPFTGGVNRLEKVDEVRLEMVLPRWRAEEVVRALRAAHPYEEVAYDLYHLANKGESYGAGAIGTLRRTMPLPAFLRHVERSLRVACVRYSGRPRQTVRRVAVCGGSGSDLLAAAIQRGADAFVTSDCSYHLFQECDNRLALVDAGHYETEQPVVARIVEHLQQHLGGPRKGVKVYPSSRMKNFVQYHMS
jgi:dinuclear metal center YbgI/SA1388 family protein